MISKGNATWNTTENLNHQTVFELWNVFHVFGTIFGQCEFPKYRTNCWSFGPAKTVVLLDRCCFCWSRAPVHQAISKTVLTRQWKFQCWWDNPEYKPWTDQGLFSIYGFRSCDQMVSANERRAYILQVSGHVRMVSVNDRWRYICKFQVTWEWSQPMIEDVTYATQFLK